MNGPGVVAGRAGALAPPPWTAFAPVPGEQVLLADGRGVRVRPVRPDDAAAEQAFVMALSPASRRRQFHGAMKQLPGSVLRAMTAVDFRHHVALVADAACADGAARLVADARYVRDDVGGAEFAIAVADDWQGLGLGRTLLRHLGRHARLSGVATLHGSVLADNMPMLALMRSLGARLRDDLADASVVQATFTL